MVIIIAILTTITLPTYLKTAERARASEALQLLAAIRSAENRYRAQSGTYTVDLDQLDMNVPGVNGTPPSPHWSFTTGAAVGSNAVATRSDGPYQNATIEMDLDSGALCSSNAIYGLAAAPC